MQLASTRNLYYQELTQLKHNKFQSKPTQKKTNKIPNLLHKNPTSINF